MFLLALSLTVGLAGIPNIAANDNRTPAGMLSRTTLRLALEARIGFWSPDGPNKGNIPVDAFGEVGKPLQIPGPLIRVPLGTFVIVRIHNGIPGTVLALHGLVDRPAVSDESLSVPSGQWRELRFRAGAAGTYYYWGSTTGEGIATRAGRDSQLVGAIVVDDPRQKWTSQNNRVLIITGWDDVLDLKRRVDFAYLVMAINGRRFPASEHLSYERGTRVTWRVINASAGDHPMHLHGFYFQVVSRGDGLRDVVYAEGGSELENTELIPAGMTTVMQWNADRAGNWMFHCHIAYHIVNFLPLSWTSVISRPSRQAMLRDSMMGSMIVPVTVVPKPNDAPLASPPLARHIDLLVDALAENSQRMPAFDYVLRENGTSMRGPGAAGPTLLLTQGQMTGITITNHLSEPTSVHWHGIELQDSYYDGVPGNSGLGRRIEPVIEPGSRFEARFAPPRAGTFIYHTHVNSIWQLKGGLSGPLIVLPKGARFDPSTDHVVQVASARDPRDFVGVLVNGVKTPPAITIAAGVPNRLRLINMTAGDADLIVSLVSANGTASWLPIARDGADIPVRNRTPEAAVETITTGETRDYLFTAPAPGDYRLLFWGFAGDALRATLPIHVTSAPATSTER